jgi:hypothetical protein
VPGVVPAGTATTIWLLTNVHVPSLVADAVARVMGVEYVLKSVVGVPASTYGLPAGTTAGAPAFIALATIVGSTVIVKSAHGMYRPAPAACHRFVAARVTLDTTESFIVSVQLTLPRFVAAVELPATSVGKVRAPGAAMLRTPPDVEPVMTCVPLAAAAGRDPSTITAPAATTPVALRNERRHAVLVDVS